MKLALLLLVCVATSFACDNTALISCLSGVATCIEQKIAANSEDYTGLCDCFGACISDCTTDILQQVFPGYNWGSALQICQNTAQCLENIGSCENSFISCHSNAGTDISANCECIQEGEQCLNNAGNCILPLDVGLSVNCSDYRDIGRALWDYEKQKILDYWTSQQGQIQATINGDWDQSTYQLSVTLTDLNDKGITYIQAACDTWADDVNGIIADQCQNRPVCQNIKVQCTVNSSGKRSTAYNGAMSWTQNSGSGLVASLSVLLMSLWLLFQ